MDFEHLRNWCRETLDEKGKDYPFKATEFLAQEAHFIYKQLLKGEAARSDLSRVINRIESMLFMMKESADLER